nr:MAG TPA: hypothetical protein [Caudoviricetes sp.]
MCFAFLFLLVTIHHFKGVKNSLLWPQTPLLSHKFTGSFL